MRRQLRQNRGCGAASRGSARAAGRLSGHTHHAFARRKCDSECRGHVASRRTHRLRRDRGSHHSIHHGRGVQRLPEDRAVRGGRRLGPGQPGQSAADGARAPPGDPARRVAQAQHVRGPPAERPHPVRYVSTQRVWYTYGIIWYMMAVYSGV